MLVDLRIQDGMKWMKLMKFAGSPPETAPFSQGNCSFNSFVVEIQAMNGGWLQNPLGCADLTQFSQTSCYLI